MQEINEFTSIGTNKSFKSKYMKTFQVNRNWKFKLATPQKGVDFVSKEKPTVRGGGKATTKSFFVSGSSGIPEKTRAPGTPVSKISNLPELNESLAISDISPQSQIISGSSPSGTAL